MSKLIIYNLMNQSYDIYAFRRAELEMICLYHFILFQSAKQSFPEIYAYCRELSPVLPSLFLNSLPRIQRKTESLSCNENAVEYH